MKQKHKVGVIYQNELITDKSLNEIGVMLTPPRKFRRSNKKGHYDRQQNLR